jgi:hypothetical protein
MQSGNRSVRAGAKHRVLEQVDMEMQDIELLGALAHRFHHQQVIGNRVAHAGIETQGNFAAGHQLGRRARVAAGEKSHVVTLSDQLLGEIGNDSFGTAVQLWRNSFVQRRDLRDSHDNNLLQ